MNIQAIQEDDGLEEITDEEYAEYFTQAYARSPNAYVQEVLGHKLWKKQKQICLALLEKKRVFVQASHGVGKSFIAACLANWHFDCFNPGITITTASNQDQVDAVVWGEIRKLRAGKVDWKGQPIEEKDLKPAESMMGSYGKKHYAVGKTSKDDTGFQGKHERNIFGIFDECVGIAPPIWDGMRGMLTGGPGNLWLAICNPTDMNSQAYLEVQGGGDSSGKVSKWHIMDISAMEHPNIKAALRGEELPFPDAVQIEFIDDGVAGWCEEIDPKDYKSTDIWWSLPYYDSETGNYVRDQKNPRCWRPGPLFETKVLGRWSTSESNSVWADAMWKAARRDPKDGYKPLPDELWINKPIQLGCDCAWSGRDFTSIVGRRGGKALHWETRNGLEAEQIAKALKDAALKMVRERDDNMKKCLQNYVGEEPKRSLIVLDHDATGAVVKRFLAGWNVISQSGMSPALKADDYPNRRSELWFSVADMANKGSREHPENGIDFSALSETALGNLHQQAIGPKWEVTARGRELEAKKITRKRIKRSPDDMDALNLAFCRPTSVVMRMPVQILDGHIVTSDGSDLVADAGKRLTDAVLSQQQKLSPMISTDVHLTGVHAEADVRRMAGLSPMARGPLKPAKRLM